MFLASVLLTLCHVSERIELKKSCERLTPSQAHKDADRSAQLHHKASMNLARHERELKHGATSPKVRITDNQAMAGLLLGMAGLLLGMVYQVSKGMKC